MNLEYAVMYVRNITTAVSSPKGKFNELFTMYEPIDNIIPVVLASDLVTYILLSKGYILD